ncbi:MAG: redoxin domain-containing protein [Proteobacteria bacterium]|nr:redoxin domain-containing protein [Pseudomonadota bacterium]MBU1739369.1 redoxin domain-containing protein [Pseudomonadota bacterium]
MKMPRTLLLISACVAILLIAGCGSEKMKKLKVGDKAPDFLVEDLSGQPFSLANAAGMPVIIRFFVTDCKFCRADTPVFNEYYAKHKDKGLKVLYLTTTVDRKRVEKFVAELAIPFPVAIDFNKKVSDLFRVRVEPQAIILGPDHVIIGAILGGVTEAELDELLKKHLQ